MAPFLSLHAQADLSIAELISFDEIIADIVSDDDFSTAGKWYKNYGKFISDRDRENLDKGFDELIQKLTIIRDDMLKMDEGARKNYEYSVPFAGESEDQKILLSFVLHVANRLGDRAQIVSRAFLIAAESSFEVLFGQVARAIYVKNPSALPKSDYSFTLEELSTYHSIDDARDFLITHRTEALLRESPDEWNKWLKRTINIELDKLIGDWPSTREMFIRRNILVHTEGRVTERYLRELTRVGGDSAGLRVGQSLLPSPEYLRSALQRLIALEMLLVFRVRSRLEKGELNSTSLWLSGKLDFLVTLSMWDAVSLVSDSFDTDQCPRNIQLSVKINGWIARKVRDGLDSVRHHISSWDTSGLEERYKITKKLLLDQLTVEELESVVEDGMFTRFEVSTHPLFASINQVASIPGNLGGEGNSDD